MAGGLPKLGCPAGYHVQSMPRLRCCFEHIDLKLTDTFAKLDVLFVHNCKFHNWIIEELLKKIASWYVACYQPKLAG